MVVLSKGIKHGRGDDILLYFNFDRSQKHHNRPLLIFTDDFALTPSDGNIFNNVEYKIPGINADKELLSGDNKLIDGDIFTGKPSIYDYKVEYTEPQKYSQLLSFREYYENNSAQNNTYQDYIKDNNMNAFFVYNIVNYFENNGNVAGSDEVKVPITSNIYCGNNEDCLLKDFKNDATLLATNYLNVLLFGEVVADKSSKSNG